MTDSQSDSPEMTKPNCTITVHHKQTLQTLAEKRYGTQSAALRTAIDKLAASIDDTETVTEQIITELQEVKTSLKSIEDLLDEQPTDQSENHRAPRPTSNQPTVETAETFNSGEDDTINGAAEDVYSVLIDSEPLRVDEVAVEIDVKQMTAHRAIEALIEKDIVTSVESDKSRFKIGELGN